MSTKVGDLCVSEVPKVPGSFLAKQNGSEVSWHVLDSKLELLRYIVDISC